MVSTNASYTFIVDSNRNLVANFTSQPQSYTITATADPANGGTVTGGGTYQQGQSCTLTATAATGYNFVNWTKNGQQVSTNASYTFTVTESATYVAHFQLQSFTISLSANPTGAGTVSGGGNYNYGASCTVVATPNQRYIFDSWTENGVVVSTDASYTFTVTTNRTLVANFGMPNVEIMASVDPAEAATVSGAGTYAYGATVTLTLDRNEDWAFVNWTEAGVEVSDEMTYTFVATENRDLVAHFEHTEGVGELSGSVLIYPNPVNDKLTVEAQEAIGTVEIYNLMGALMYSQKGCGNMVEINTGNLTAGVYFIRLTNNKVTETRRFVKK